MTRGTVRQRPERPRTRRLITANRKGWLVWTWGKVGALIVFTALMLVLMSTFTYLLSASAAQEANALARDLGGQILDTYNSQLTMNFERRLPDKVDGRDYDLEFLNTGGILGIVVRTRDSFAVSGGASVSIPYDDVTIGPGLDSEYLCINKFEGEIYIEWSRCE